MHPHLNTGSCCCTCSICYALHVSGRHLSLLLAVSSQRARRLRRCGTEVAGHQHAQMHHHICVLANNGDVCRLPCSRGPVHSECAACTRWWRQPQPQPQSQFPTLQPQSSYSFRPKSASWSLPHIKHGQVQTVPGKGEYSTHTYTDRLKRVIVIVGEEQHCIGCSLIL